MKRKLLLLIITGLVLCMTGCTKEMTINGGITDNSDRNAPKTIESKDIREMRTWFYVGRAFNDQLNGHYDITLTKDGDHYILEEDEHFKIKETVNKEDVDGIYRIIDKYGLVKENGIDKVTAGLPDEYQPLYMSCTFESDEKLYFRYDNEPESEWIYKLAKYLRDVFIAKGHEELIPPEKHVTQYDITFKHEDTMYEYFFIIDKDGILKNGRRVFDGKDKDSMVMEELPADFNERLIEIVESCELDRFHQGSLFNGNYDELRASDFYEIYIDFDDGSQIYGWSNDEDKVREFNHIEDELFGRLDAMFSSGAYATDDENTIQSLRQGIFDEDADLGIACLGYCEGPIGDGIINVIEGTDYVSDFSFLRRIPFDNYVETIGSDYFLILPVSDGCSLAINDEDGNVLYRSEDGEPVILLCDSVSGNAQINVVNGSKSLSFYLKMENGKIVTESGIKDISIY